MSRKLIWIAASLLAAAIVLTACVTPTGGNGPDGGQNPGGANAPLTSVQWDKAMRDTYDALTKADANYKIVSSGTTVSGDDEHEYVMLQTFYVAGNKAKGDFSLTHGDFNPSGATYYELTVAHTLKVWQTDADGAVTVEAESDPIDLDDLNDGAMSYGGFKIAGKVTIGALLSGALNLNDFTGMFDYFTFDDGWFKAKEERLEGIYNEFYMKMADGSGITDPPEGCFERFSIRIENGLLAGFEFKYVSEEMNLTTVTSYAVVFGGQSVSLPENFG